MIKITPLEHLSLMVLGTYAALYAFAYIVAEIIFRITIKKEDRL